MLNKVVFLGIWVLFLGYGFFFSPPDNPNTMDLIINLSKGSWQGINPYIISLFNLMGILPMIYASLLIIDGRNQRIMATPFVVGSFFLGAFALLPYLGLRENNSSFTGEKGFFIKILDSKVSAIALTLGTIILIIFALRNGNWNDFINQWQSSKFINIMTLDFCCLCSLFPVLIQDDLRRRNIDNQKILWAVTFIPLFGTLFYLCFRPSLSVDRETLTTQTT